jgi:hypothetical protein
MLMRGLTGSAYDPSGHLLFGRDGMLIAQPFDVKTLQLNGDPAVIAEGASLDSDARATRFSASGKQSEQGTPVACVT